MHCMETFIIMLLFILIYTIDYTLSYIDKDGWWKGERPNYAALLLLLQ